MSLSMVTINSQINSSGVPKLELTVPADGTRLTQNRWSAMCWARHSSVNTLASGDYSDLIAYSDNNQVIGLGLAFIAGQAGQRLDLGDLASDNLGGPVIADGDWHHYALTVQPSGANTACYGWLDGVQVVSGVNLVPPSAAGNWFFRFWNSRASVSDNTAMWTGQACALKVWDGVAMSGPEINLEMRGYAPRARLAHLWAWLPCFGSGMDGLPARGAALLGGRVLSPNWTVVDATPAFTNGPDPPGVSWDYPLSRRKVGRFFRPPQNLSLALADGPSTADVIADLVDHPRTLADAPQTAADSMARALAALRGPADAPFTSDSLARVLQELRAGQDAPLSVDVLGRALAEPRGLADAPGSVDSVGRILQAPRAVADAPLTTDGLARVLQGFRTLFAAPGTADGATASKLFPRTVTDTALVAGQVFRQVASSRTAADVPSTADAFSRTFVGVRTLTDNPISLSEGGAVRRLILTRSLPDTPQTADSVLAVSGAKTAVASDSPHTADAASRTLALIRTLPDAPGAVDAAMRVLSPQLRSLFDFPSAGVSIVAAGQYHRQATDAAHVTDSASRVLARLLTIGDVPTVQDMAIAGTGSVVVSAADIPLTVDLIVAFKKTPLATLPSFVIGAVEAVMVVKFMVEAGQNLRVAVEQARKANFTED